MMDDRQTARAIAMARAKHRARDLPHEGGIEEAAELAAVLDAYFAHTIFRDAPGWGGSHHRFEPAPAQVAVTLMVAEHERKGERVMTLEEARKIVAIMNTADRGCGCCAGNLLERFVREFPAFTVLLHGDAVEPYRPLAEITGDLEDESDEPAAFDTIEVVERAARGAEEG